MMGRKAREIKRLKAGAQSLVDASFADHEYATMVEAQRDAAVKRAEAAEAKLKAVRKALGILDPTTSTSINLQSPGFTSTTGYTPTFSIADAYKSFHSKPL